MRTLGRPTPAGVERRRGLVVLALVSGAVFIGATVLARRGEPLPLEIGAFEWVNGLPDWLYYVIWPFMQYGVFVTIPIATGLALLASRRRLAAMLAASGLGIYLAAKVVKQIASRGRPGAFVTDLHAREHFAAGSLGYTSGHAAVAATIATLTVTHLPRPWRQASVVLVAVVAFGRMYVGAHLPLDLVGGVAMGVATGAAVTRVFGSGGGRLGPPEEEAPVTDTRPTSEPRATAVPVAPDDVEGDPAIERAPVGRHPGDAVRVAVGLVVLASSLLAVQRDRLTTFEANLFHLVNELPSQLSPVLVVVMQAGNVFAAPVAAIGMLVVARRHRRAAIDVLVAGGVAWFAAKAVKDIVQRPRPTGFFDDVQRYTGQGLGFVSGHTAVAAAIATAAAPYLPRRWRRALWALAWVVGFTRIHFGAHLPLDIVGGAAVGWVIGALIHVILGAPHRVPSLDEAAAALRRAGTEPSSVRRVPGSPRGSFPFVAITDGRPVFVKLLDPEPRENDLIHRAWRLLAFRDVRDEVEGLDASEQAHREAAMTLLARTHGARVPAIHAIERDGDRVWLMEEYVESQDLERLAVDSVTDDVLRDLWAQVARLHAARVAHRDLVTSNVLVDACDDVWIVDLAHAKSAASPRALANDVAELLATTSFLVGPARAVAAARAVLGEQALGRSLPELQELSLTAGTRRRLRRSGEGLGELRREVAAACGSGLAPSTSERPSSRRVLATTVAIAASFTGLLALAGPGATLDEIATPGYRWLGLAILSLVVAELCRAGGLLAAIDRRHALGRTALAQISSFSSGVLDGRSAGREELVTYLERAGVPPAEGRHGLAVARRAHIAASALALVVAAVAAWRAPLELEMPGDALWLLLLALACAAPPLVAAGRRRRPPGPPSAVTRTFRAARWPVLAIAAAGEIAARVTCATAAAVAMGHGAPVAGIAAVYLVTTLLGTSGPVAAAPGTGEVAMAAGLMAVGMTVAPAVAAALAARILLLWAPVVAGRLFRQPLHRRLAPSPAPSVAAAEDR